MLQELSSRIASTSTPRQLACLLEERTDAEVTAAVATAGVDRTIDQVFTGMVSHYRPLAGPRRRVVVEFVILTDEGARVRQFVANREHPRWHLGAMEAPHVKVELRLVDFLRLVSGSLDAFVAVAQRKLKVKGNWLTASGIQRWFDLSA